MKKPLHASMLVWERGQLIEWGTKKDVKNLLKSANEARVFDENKPETGTWKELSDIFIYEWFEKIVQRGINIELVKELNPSLSHLEFRRQLMLADNKELYWREVADGKILELHPRLKTTYIISHLLAIGALKGLKRCKMTDCRKFFIGPPNKLWCSTSCGSKHRVRKKRKQDIKSGTLF